MPLFAGVALVARIEQAEVRLLRDAVANVARRVGDGRVLARPLAGGLAQGPGVVRFAARRGGELAGAASMRLGEGIAQLCGAGTLPAHRGRGVQTALLAHRLAVAAAAGCELAVITTQPGSKSQENAHRRGFELLYARAVLVRGE